jgi:hypothetical protein
MDRLKWNEPAAYRCQLFRQRERRNPWEAYRLAVIVFALILVLRGLAGIGNANRNLPDWLPVLGISLAVALVVAFIFPLLLSWVSVSIVILSEKGINNNVVGHGATINFWPWDRVEYCTTSVDRLGDKSYPTISMHAENDEILATFGLQEKPTVDEIRAWLERNGKELREQTA